MLLGPLSETMSSVSCRDCALAGDKIAGAETMPAARRGGGGFQKVATFHGLSPARTRLSSGDTAKVMPIEWKAQ